VIPMSQFRTIGVHRESLFPAAGVIRNVNHSKP
jgi:hypothetical protein